MPAQSEQLAKFQVDLSSHSQARITPAVVDDVLRSISYLDDKTAAKIGRETDVSFCTINRHVKGETSPRTNRFVRILNKLGYDLYIVKRNDSPQ